MEVEVIKRYTINCLETVSIPNQEFIEVKELNKELIIQVVSKAFSAIECSDVLVDKVLLSPEIDELFSKDLEIEFYYKHRDNRCETISLWTADVTIVEGLDCVVFIGVEGDIISWDVAQ